MATKKPAVKKPAARADLGANIDTFFDKQTGETRATLDAFRAIIEKSVPKAEAAIKWGMPMWTVGGEIVCGLRAAKKHVGLILRGPSDGFKDPKGLLEGEGATGRQYKVGSAREIDAKQVAAWLKTSTAFASK